MTKGSNDQSFQNAFLFFVFCFLCINTPLTKLSSYLIKNGAKNLYEVEKIGAKRWLALQFVHKKERAASEIL